MTGAMTAYVDNTYKLMHMVKEMLRRE
eukprot:IDg18957t1